MGLIDKVISWGNSKGLQYIEKQIQKVIKEKRLVFLDDNHVGFIDKDNKKHAYTFDQVVGVAIETGKWQEQMNTLGITTQDIKDILTQEYEKQNKGAK
jgi:hypothetical protein